MNDLPAVHAAMQCLLQLESHPASAEDISAASGVALPMCRQLLSRLRRLGIVRVDAECRFVLTRALEEWSTLELIDAVWVTPRG